MHDDTTQSSTRRTGLYTLLTIGVVACMVACGSLLGKPRQGWSASNGPVVPHDTFPADCSLCHTGNDWTTIRKDFTFDHEKETGVPLNGAHKDAACLRCHNDRGKAGAFAAKGCAGCHQDIHRGQLGGSCVSCHNEASWRPTEIIARHNRTRFPLVGAHVVVACFRCHPGAQVGNYAGADPTCATCHQADLARATVPDHAAQGWVSDCQRCHNQNAWKPAKFNHPASFPLTAGHAGRACTACHQGGVYTGLSTSCSSCHMPQYQATTNPNHTASGFGTTCNQCHTTATWLGAQFNHPASFPLTAGHAGRACASCHVGGVYTGLSTACSSCHMAKYAATTNPNHTAAGFSTTCNQCHTTATWANATYSHTASFPLTGGHAGRSCSQCHTSGVFTGLSTTCSSCHMANYQATTNPNHTTAGYSTTCNQCHSTASWAGATFNHPASFPLTAGHAGRTCNQCHTNGVFTGLSTTCSSCHMANYTATTNPNHTAAGFATTCNQCHTTATWSGATFTHVASFPLTAGHAGRTCNQCHTNGVFTGLSTACSSCHMATFQATTNPNHVAAGFPTTCNTCHTTATWAGGTFTHKATFPLTGGHAGRTCNQCHTNGVFTGLSTACSSCHLARYQATTNPNHTAAGFPTTCNSCHSTASWSGATFTHTFPITSGNHNVACNQCHLNASNFHEFTCTACHAHAQSTMASKHNGVGGYQWVSAACYQCHPQGRH